ncbi:hypothetical protein HK100_012941 [Physocladia obscura]|uniref:Uncharacterized protein n=1 Tax=Physocladia obscura TaxID=109957 RepID=A0AAD5SZE0_9FUNG|nr:hypothetical protein HK100_012941 [Physocladia obscura]
MCTTVQIGLSLAFAEAFGEFPTPRLSNAIASLIGAIASAILLLIAIESTRVSVKGFRAAASPAFVGFMAQTFVSTGQTSSLHCDFKTRSFSHGISLPVPLFWLPSYLWNIPRSPNITKIATKVSLGPRLVLNKIAIGFLGFSAVGGALAAFEPSSGNFKIALAVFPRLDSTHLGLAYRIP